MTTDFPPLIVILPCAAFCVVSTACFYHVTARYIFPYRLHPDRLQVLLLGILPIAEIRFRDIADIRKRTFPEAFLLGFNPGVLLLHNRFFGQWLLIYKTRG